MFTVLGLVFVSMLLLSAVRAFRAKLKSILTEDTMALFPMKLDIGVTKMMMHVRDMIGIHPMVP